MIINYTTYTLRPLSAWFTDASFWSHHTLSAEENIEKSDDHFRRVNCIGILSPEDPFPQLGHVILDLHPSQVNPSEEDIEIFSDVRCHFPKMDIG